MDRIARFGLIIVYGIILSLLSFRLTAAFFTDSANSTDNTFTAAAEFPISSPTHIVINEVFVDGGANSEWVELFNPTASTAALDGWKLTDNTSTEIFPSGLSLAPNAFAIVVASGSSVSIPGGVLKIETNTTPIGNGLTPNDRLLLEQPDGSDVDSVSFGSDQTYFTIATPSATQSTRRIPNGNDTDNASDWQNGSLSKGVTN